MKLSSDEPVQVLEAKKKSFTNKQGVVVDYTECRIFDGIEIYTCGVGKEIADSILENIGARVIATFEISKQKAEGTGQDKVKLRLTDYEEVL